ncbi:hypothetical protein [Geomesophilobacter sediminis]|uniref:Uncharacterized protein n=1 Tax=Geomesophilobacter sediminis TaxID=2798584 RepID=A0A8J7M4S3_9BACT|nr:hypothetical protein [Geomesophilobacter sediminis]MBJ6727953.1 hypothetical protein [Geomesophilobacter sediminis]
MAKPNFKFQKRQKELDKKKKQEEKLLRKQEKAAGPVEVDPDDEHELAAVAPTEPDTE